MHVLFKTGPGIKVWHYDKELKVWIYDATGVAQRRSATARLCEIDSTCSAIVDRQRVQCSLYRCTCSSPLTVHSVRTGYRTL